MARRLERILGLRWGTEVTSEEKDLAKPNGVGDYDQTREVQIFSRCRRYLTKADGKTVVIVERTLG